MKVNYLRICQARAAANNWPDWADKGEHDELLYVRENGEESILLPARATKVLDTDRQEICSYNVGFRSLYEEVDYQGLSDFHKDVQVRAGDDAKQAIIVAEPTDLVRQRPSVPTVRRVHDRGDSEGAPLTGDIRTDMLIIDIDGGAVPGLDLANPIPAVRAALCKAYPQFADAGIVLQLTAKQDPDARGVMRGRVYVELTEPIHRLQQQWWQRQLAEAAPYLKIDVGIMDSARVVYIAPPICVAEKSVAALVNPDASLAPDPLEDRRWFFDDGPTMAPPAELPDVSEIQTLRRASGPGIGGGHFAGLRYLREGEELSVFDQTDELHPSILASTFWLVVRGAEPTHAADEVVDYICNVATGPLRERLNAEPGRLVQIEKEVLDAAQGTAEKFASHRQLIQGVLPWCPRPRELTPEEGVREVQRVVREVFEGRLKRVMLAGAAGLGKSYEAAQEAARSALRIDVYDPTHNLVQEQVQIFQEAGCKGIAILSGREKSGCVKASAIGKMSADQYPLSTAQLCGAEDADSYCPEFENCKYVRDRCGADEGAKTVFRTTATLSHDPSWLESNFEKDIGKPETVVVDEDFTSAAVSTLSVPMGDLKRSGLLGAVIHEALLSEGSLLDAIEDCFVKHRTRWCSGRLPDLFSGATGEIDIVTENTALDEVVEGEWYNLKRQRLRGAAAASMDERELLAAVEKTPGGFAYYQIIRGLRRCILDERDIWNGVFEENGQAIVVVRHHLSRLRRRNQSVLLIDATADPLITEALLPGTEFVDVCARRNAYVFQVCDHTFSYKWLDEAPARLEDVGAFIRLHAEFMRPGVGHPKDRLGNMFDHDGIDAVTFGKERGVNTLEDCDIGFVVSRVQPSATACEEIARGLWPHDDLQLPGDFIRVPMGYNMRDGRTVGVMGWAHVDPRVNTVLRSKREGALEQMLDRFRLIHNSETKLVYVFTSQPFNVVVDELLALEKAIGPARLMRLVEEYHPEPLPLSPEHLALIHPDLFKGVSGAAKFCTQVRKWLAKNAWRAPVELVEGAAPSGGGRRITTVRSRTARVEVELASGNRAEA